MTQDSKIHHCEYCGAETEDFDEAPNGRKVYVCGSSKCGKELQADYQYMQDERRHRAEEDEYSRY
jgi:hypothetical protein